MMRMGAGGEIRGEAQFWAHGVRFSEMDGTRSEAQNSVPPARKNAPALLTERMFERGDSAYLRRDYEDGTVDLIYYDVARGAWVYEIYRRYEVAGMDYDFEDCLASPVFFMRYLVAIAVR